jgi:hypothetical protein
LPKEIMLINPWLGNKKFEAIELDWLWHYTISLFSFSAFSTQMLLHPAHRQVAKRYVHP